MTVDSRDNGRIDFISSNDAECNTNITGLASWDNQARAAFNHYRQVT